MTTFKIVRHVFKGRSYVVAAGLTEEEAKEWCSDPETSSSTATNPVGPVPDGPWFDDYTEEDPSESGRYYVETQNLPGSETYPHWLCRKVGDGVDDEDELVAQFAKDEIDIAKSACRHLNKTQGDRMTSKTDEEARERLGQRLREAREYLGFSQEEVAAHLGVPRTALSNMEAGKRKVDTLELTKLAKLYRQQVSTLAGTDEEAVSALPADVAHLAREATKMSVRDREELASFAEYLQNRSGLMRRGW